MKRADWSMSRGRKAHMNSELLPNSLPWLEKFKSSENTGISAGIYAISFLSIDQAILTNKNLKNLNLSVLCGKPNNVFPPGDFDPNQGYLIGLTDDVDEGIFVDLRPSKGPCITYSNHDADGMQIVTAFQSIDEFIQFYLEQHD